MDPTQIESILSKALGNRVELFEQTVLSGGSISKASRLTTSHGTFFLKTNSATHPPMFEAEVLGLNTLRGSDTVSIPQVIAVGKTEDIDYLILELIEETPYSKKFWRSLGRSVAQLHRSSASTFGAEQNNYIGSLVQSNSKHSNWIEFFVSERLEPLVKKAFDMRRLEAGDPLRFERLFNKLELLIPKENPALLHGDLWSGNHLCGADSTPYLIDPAVYYGHREMDIAMSHLFGGFDPIFYESYNSNYPMETGWEERIAIHNMYPLLVHVILFGGNYASQLSQTLKHWA